MLAKLGRILIFIVAVLVIILSIAGIIGAWWASSVASDVTLDAFLVVETGVGVVDAAVDRVDGLIETGRMEVQQTEETIVTVAGNVQENRPVLTALNERLEARLGPAISRIQEALAPVRDALVTVSSIVSFANSIPFIQEQAPQLAEIEQAFDTLSELVADSQQLRGTLRSAVAEEADQLTEETVTVLTGLTSRIDSGLAEIETEVQAIQAEVEALQQRLEDQKSRLLLIFNLAALALTLLFLWVIYSQIVVIRHHWRLLQAPAQAGSGSPQPDRELPEATSVAELPQEQAGAAAMTESTQSQQAQAWSAPQEEQLDDPQGRPADTEPEARVAEASTGETATEPAEGAAPPLSDESGGEDAARSEPDEEKPR